MSLESREEHYPSSEDVVRKEIESCGRINPQVSASPSPNKGLTLQEIEGKMRSLAFGSKCEASPGVKSSVQIRTPPWALVLFSGRRPLVSLFTIGSLFLYSSEAIYRNLQLTEPSS